MPFKLRKFLRLRSDADSMSSSSKKDGTPARTKPPSGSKVAASPGNMKESKSDNSVFTTPTKKQALAGKPLNSPCGKPGSASPLNKNYLSKSHENLTSHQKQKLAALQTRPKSSLGLPETKKKSASNKENVQVKDKDGFLKPKPLKPSMTSTPMRKASSQQQIDKMGTGHTSKNQGGNSSKTNNMKRAHSTQNVSKEKAVKKRTSATPDVMAYNAELLANFEKDKKNQEAKISELIQVAESRKMDIEKYKYEIKKLKEQTPSQELEEEVEILRTQNAVFKEQLIKLGVPIESQITDAEKLSLKKNQKEAEYMIPTSVSCDSLSTDGHPISMMPMVIGAGMKRSPSITMSEPGMSFGDYCRSNPDHSLDLHGKWDTRSKSSDALSDISVANLTERILQMEETHYSTNEELQATLQELGDLQDAVNELTEENERLADERSVLLESLCTQTEKLEHCRTQIEQLKCLLISGELPNKSDRDQHLLELLKGAQDEREEFLRKLHAAESDARVYQSHTETVREKSQLLEDKVSALKSEKENLDKQLMEMKESLANEQIEVAHFKTLLDNEKTKVQELESYCKANDQSDLEQLLHNTRQEKDKLEERLADVQDALAHSQNEVTNLKDQIIVKEEEVKVHRNNAKSQVIDMEYKLELVKKDRYDFQQELEHLREHIDQLEQDSDKYFEERKNYTAKIQELQGEVSVMRQLKEVAEAELQENKLKHEAELEDWKQFQKDLQVAVVIANDFRSETQGDMEKLQSDNATYKEKCQSLEAEIAKLKSEIDAYKIQEKSGTLGAQKSSILSSAELKGKVISTMDKELSYLREGRRMGEKTQQTLSVKNLIRSIEEQVKSGCSSIHSSSCSSRRNSDSESSLVGIRDFQEIMKSPSSPVGDQGLLSPENGTTPLRSVLRRTSERPSPLNRHSLGGLPFDGSSSPNESPKSAPPISRNDTPPSLTSILSSRTPSRRSSGVNLDPGSSDRKENSSKDPLAGLAKSFKGSKRNALLKWCQQKTITYSNVDVTNFSSSWNDGLAFCALIHSYLPDKIPYGELTSEDKRRNFTLAFNAAESVGIHSNLNINDMVAMERPDWQAVFTYVTSIYKHFEVDNKGAV
ncbi:cytospin-A-like isoform X2 [Ruditapes philippinarum]|uniref:cytospin-A-like isoform X2 n=1 Tax=Ruditapes philippinarum TaxID=129788 RepID=UPI00295B11BB|nr:cytospin-A-like isoform X2 [Ruditapes philippinarum]